MKVWHESTEDDIPEKHRLCFVALVKNTVGFAQTRFDFAYILDSDLFYGQHVWEAHEDKTYQLEEVEKWAYMDDLLNCDEKEDGNE